MLIKHKKLEIKPCSEYIMEDGKPKCKSGHVAMFGICYGHPEGSIPYRMREEPPEHLYDDGLPIGWKLAEKKYKVAKPAKECQEHYEQSVFYRGQDGET